MVTWMPGLPPTPRLTFQSARLADDVSDARPAHDIDGVSAITRAILVLTTVCASTTSCSPSCLLAASRRLFALMTPKPLKLPQPAYLAASGKMMLAACRIGYASWGAGLASM